MAVKALIAGHFSTVGDLECLDLVRRWIQEQGMEYDVAPYSRKIRPLLEGSLDPAKVDARQYSHLVIVCGPCWEELLRRRHLDLKRFDHCVRIGINLTMVQPLDDWNPFDVLLERDSDRAERPDLAFLGLDVPRRVAGRCIITKQSEYGERQRHSVAIAAIDEVIQRLDLMPLELDTRWAASGNPLRTASDFSALLGRCDLLLTNRLHGLVFAVRGGIPVIAVDGVAGGGKVLSQAQSIGWPMARCAEEVTPAWMDDAVAWCVSEKGREKARECGERARLSLSGIGDEFVAALHSSTPERPPSESPGWLRGMFARLSRKI